MIRVAVDVGGTFTDVVLLFPDGSATPIKVLSTPDDFARGIKEGLQGALQESKVDPKDVGEFIHGATVATNAIITRNGALTGLITNKGFRDVLEIRRLRAHKLYNTQWEKPAPLVPRNLRLEVTARINHKGEEETPLNEEEARAAIQRLLNEGVESMAVCFLHAYANYAHELRVRELIREANPNIFVSLSGEVLPEIKEYERVSTTVINAYVQPVVHSYFRRMEDSLKELEISTPIRVMQSNGGMMLSEEARERPIHIIESGPAAGVIGAHQLAQRMGLEDVLTLDMGGTTAKASLIEEGILSRSPEYEVGGEASMGHRLLKGSGYLLRVPSVDLVEVGAGGGSIAWLDQARALHAGPQSAGAAPGAACYNLGGTDPTITDANVLLGFNNRQFLAGGTLSLYPDLAEKAIQEKIAAPLGIDTITAAWGIRAISNSNLMRTLRAVSSERGRDPRRYALVAFGGMGPIHAVDLAKELGVTKVVVPLLPGLFSSLGLLFAEVEHHYIKTHYASLSQPDFSQLNSVLEGLTKEGLSSLSREGYTGKQVAIDLSADARYRGQDFAITIPLQGDGFDKTTSEALVEDFHREHDKTYGYRSDNEEVQIVALRAIARGLQEDSRFPPALRVTERGKRPDKERQVYFGRDLGWITVTSISREEVTDKPIQGPVIVDESNSSTVVPPDWMVFSGQWDSMILQPQSS